ncbi:hypothetical protein BY996DRAFT_4348781 [Phakopsora pachyrhizi]|uniref:Expressed protein n=1 Tax=Phakopsora pachyrhizi TaxID=170000 RepID=A0AAV0B0T4_PHAPC|nr:hypothetical protein BY996DRAFT_4348781 [Phakopsora pachyrhizi]CAH7675675.1 expressed protein [Phakopsora pachyrhizi]
MMRSRIQSSLFLDQLVRTNYIHHRSSSSSNIPKLAINRSVPSIPTIKALLHPGGSTVNSTNRPKQRSTGHLEIRAYHTLNSQQSSSSSVVIPSKYNHSTISESDHQFLSFLSSSILNKGSRDHFELDSVELWSILKRLNSNNLFSQLDPGLIERLIDLISSNYHLQSQKQTHQNFILDSHQQILYILDRIYESINRFESYQLERFHTLCLKKYVNLGYYDGAEIVWDMLITKRKSPDSSTNGTTIDQLLMIASIHKDLVIRTQDRIKNQTVLESDPSAPLVNQSQQKNIRSKKQIRRMISLAADLGNGLLKIDCEQDDAKSSQVSNRTRGWIIRSISEILCSQGEISKLQDWLKIHLGIDLQYPDSGSTLDDPKINSGIVEMYKTLGDLSRMVLIYYAAREPSLEMIRRTKTMRGKNRRNKLQGYFDSALSFENDNSSNLNQTAKQEDDQVDTQLDGHSVLNQRKTHVILTKTYHDLIETSVEANRAHLAIHFLREAIENFDQDLKRFSNGIKNSFKGSIEELKDVVEEDFLKVPDLRSILRLQPSNYSSLIRYLIKKKRSYQLSQVRGLTERLVGLILVELDWIRDLSERRIKFIENHYKRCHKSSSSQSSRVDAEGLLSRSLGLINSEEKYRWEDLLRSIVPTQDSEQQRIDNQVLEKMLFSDQSYTQKFEFEEEYSKQEYLLKASKDQYRQDSSGTSDQPSTSFSLDKLVKQKTSMEEDALMRKFMRLKERVNFLTKSLKQSIELINNLQPIINRLKLDRSIRFERSLIKVTHEKQKRLQQAVSEHKEEGRGGTYEKIERIKDRIRGKVDEKRNEQRVRGAYNNYNHNRNKSNSNSSNDLLFS